MRTRGAGFTLIELLFAMALLSAMGALLVQLVRGSLDMYEQGDARGDLYANALPILEMLEQDLAAIDSGPDGRLILRVDSLGGGRGAGDGFLLKLVRTLPHGEHRHPVLRKAGTAVGAAEVYTGGDPGIKERGALAPPSGVVEVAWALIAEPNDPEGILTLFRGTRAPVLAEGGFFDPATEGGQDEAWVRKNLTPVATGILGLWVLCFGQGAVDWDEEAVLDGSGTGNESTLAWDSTRGILSSSVFPLARGPQSYADPRDDVYPKKVRIILHVARPSRPDALLRQALRPDVQWAELNNTSAIPPEGAYVKVGSEWLAVGNRDRGGVAVQRRRLRTRGVKSIHPPGTPVYAGKVFRKTLGIPAFRSYWEQAER